MFTTLHRAGAALALILPPLVGAASAQTTPRAFLEQATPSGAANSVTLYRVPVVTSTGAIVYKDVQIQFNVSAAGALTLKPGFPVVTNSAVLLTGNFLPGRYKLGVNKFVLSGPGVAAGGRTSWSIDDETGAGSCLKSAGWTSGPISGHPFQRRLTTARESLMRAIPTACSAMSAALATEFPTAGSRATSSASRPQRQD